MMVFTVIYAELLRKIYENKTNLWKNNVLFVAKLLGELASRQCYMQNPRVACGSIMGPMTYSSQIIPKEVTRESKI